MGTQLAYNSFNMPVTFDESELRRLWRPREDSSGEDNGQVVIIGGSELFTGAPLLSLVAASRIVDMVFLATPESDREAAEKTVLFSKLKSVIWVPRDDLEAYVEKADAVLIGPGMKRFHAETDERPDEKRVFDGAGTQTRMLTQYLLTKFPQKRWVVDGGSLQVIEAKWLPKGAIITPNAKEYELLFGSQFSALGAQESAKKYAIVISYKGPVSYVTDGEMTYEIRGGNAGLTKGGTGDVQAGLTVGLAAKNEPILAAATASWVVKKTAEELYERVGFHFNADDVAGSVFGVLGQVAK